MAKGSCHILTALRRFIWLCALTACCLSAFAEQIKLDALQVGSKVYKKVTVLGFNATDVFFTHSKGISNAKLKYLDEDMKKLFNYDARTGDVTAWIEAAGLLTPEEARRADVLNGIAQLPAPGRFVLTGKLWPRAFEVEFVPGGAVR